MNDYPKITFTMTTCKRFELFKRTMESFMDTCLDKDLIIDWHVNDDRSPDNEFEEMKRLYPFINFHRSPRPGQAASLNYLFSLVKTEWFLHMEDDWLFLLKDNYIRKMLDVVRVDQTIKNIILRHWECDVETKEGISYRVHKYNAQGSHMDMVKRDCLWYGYSLNPGLQHKPTVDILGLYDENHDIKNRHWDKPQAKKYLEMGLRRANLMDKYIEHIGGNNSVYENEKLLHQRRPKPPKPQRHINHIESKYNV